MKEEIKLNVGQIIPISLESRGSLGLSLQYEIDLPYLIECNRLPIDIQPNIQPGNPIKATFSIKAVREGICNIRFTETQPWNKEFIPVIKKEIQVTIEK
jgi:hypothetical protein